MVLIDLCRVGCGNYATDTDHSSTSCSRSNLFYAADKQLMVFSFNYNIAGYSNTNFILLRIPPISDKKTLSSILGLKKINGGYILAEEALSICKNSLEKITIPTWVITGQLHGE